MRSVSERIVVISDYAFYGGGVSASIESLLPELKKYYSISLITWKDSATNNNLILEHWKSFCNSILLIDEGNISIASNALFDAKLIILHTSWNVRLLSLFTLEFIRDNADSKLISIVHTSENSTPFPKVSRLQSRWLNDICLNSREVVAVSQAVKNSLLQLPIYRDNGSSNICIINNGTRFTKSEESNKCKSGKVVAFVGRPVREKGIRDFLSIAEALSNSSLNFMCNTVVQSEYEYSNTLANIQFTHSLNKQEMQRFYESIDVLVAPFIAGDGMPLVVLEALSLRVPVIGYSSPGLVDLLKEYGQIIVDKGNHREIVSILERWSKNQISLPSVRNETQHWNDAAHQYLNLLQRLLQK